MNDVTITEASLNDVDTLFRWGEENWELWGGEESKWYNKEELAALIGINKEDLFFIARYDKKPVGMCLTRVFEGWAYLESLFVIKDYRGQGIGTMLVNKMVGPLKKRKIRNLSIQPEVENNKALSLYKKLGFVQGFTFHWMDKAL
ncbi:MAG: GNAT family N-acetyltransferase [Candidatus Gottesmanbacteria bacterium]|nr:GNAT family N-acetyltransferase [Candidatus Gottesmanbacteria bacterium]